MKSSTFARNRVERASRAPRYIGVTRFAQTTHVDLGCLARWRRDGPVWVPSPDIALGRNQRPGWSIDCATAWTPATAPYPRAATIEYLDTAQMRARHRMGYEVLWQCIAHGDIDEPAIWLDDMPGWLPPLEA